MKNLSNVILIAGAGRNVGKTNFACYLIERFSAKLNLTAIKISPHFHDEKIENEIIYRSEDILILKETNPHLHKDSSRMLKAGAAEVYYIQAEDKHLTKAIEVLKLCKLNTIPVICESASLRKFIKPGLFVFIENNHKTDSLKNIDLKNKADIIIQSSNDAFDFNFEYLRFNGKEWKLLK